MELCWVCPYQHIAESCGAYPCAWELAWDWHSSADLYSNTVTDEEAEQIVWASDKCWPLSVRSSYLIVAVHTISSVILGVFGTFIILYFFGIDDFLEQEISHIEWSEKSSLGRNSLSPPSITYLGETRLFLLQKVPHKWFWCWCYCCCRYRRTGLCEVWVCRAINSASKLEGWSVLLLVSYQEQSDSWPLSQIYTATLRVT